MQAFMIHKVKRFDISGKRQLEYSEKFFVADAGLRFGLIGYSDSDISGLLENIVYIELIQRGYTVKTGQLNEFEIDFIAEKQGEKLYIQVAYLLESESTVEREFGNLLKIKDNFPKMVLSLDEYWGDGKHGILRKNIVDFLMEDISKT
jgi:predicted AAA+ superfamily ATPase